MFEFVFADIHSNKYLKIKTIIVATTTTANPIPFDPTSTAPTSSLSTGSPVQILNNGNNAKQSKTQNMK